MKYSFFSYISYHFVGYLRKKSNVHFTCEWKGDKFAISIFIQKILKKFRLLVIKYQMARRTKKVGICGKYGTRYGASLRKTIRKIEVSQRKKYPCPFCGKTAVRRNVVGVWTCEKCRKATTGGAYTPTTPTALAARAAIKRLREAQSK